MSYRDSETGDKLIVLIFFGLPSLIFLLWGTFLVIKSDFKDLFGLPLSINLLIASSVFGRITRWVIK